MAAQFTVKAQLPNGKWHTQKFSTYQQAGEFAEACLTRKLAVKLNKETIKDAEALRQWMGKHLRQAWT